jgi:hypothetical protein
MGKVEKLINIHNFLVATDNQATIFFHTLLYIIIYFSCINICIFVD